MSNILLTCSCDSLAAKVIEKLGANNPVFFEPETNTSDVFIAETICANIVYIVLIFVVGFLAWKLIDHHAKKKVDMRKREWDIEDKNLKQKADLIDKYLDFLKEQTKDKSLYINKDQTSENIVQKIKDTIVPEKKQATEIDHTEITQFRQVLEYLIELSQKGTLNIISKKELDIIFKQPKDEN